MHLGEFSAAPSATGQKFCNQDPGYKPGAKENLKANLEMDLSELKRTKLATFKELQATMKYIASLHAECDWLVQFFEVGVGLIFSEGAFFFCSSFF